MAILTDEDALRIELDEALRDLKDEGNTEEVRAEVRKRIEKILGPGFDPPIRIGEEE